MSNTHASESKLIFFFILVILLVRNYPQKIPISLLFPFSTRHPISFFQETARPALNNNNSIIFGIHRNAIKYQNKGKKSNSHLDQISPELFIRKKNQQQQKLLNDRNSLILTQSFKSYKFVCILCVGLQCFCPDSWNSSDCFCCCCCFRILLSLYRFAE